MAKKIQINIDSLKRPKKETSSKLFNIRVEEKLYDAFRTACEDDLNQSASEVIRLVMEDIAKQFNRLK